MLSGPESSYSPSSSVPGVQQKWVRRECGKLVLLNPPPRFCLTPPKHVRDVHGATGRRGTLTGLRRTQENATNRKKQPIPDGPSTAFPDVCLPISVAPDHTN